MSRDPGGLAKRTEASAIAMTYDKARDTAQDQAAGPFKVFLTHGTIAINRAFARWGSELSDIDR